MTTLDIIFLGVALAMDAFAVSICKGLRMTRINYKQGAVIALYFGGFQALMPFLGWLLGSAFARFIDQYDHWIAFGLLLFLGGKMILETAREHDEEDSGEKDLPLDHKELFLMAVATSIDALAAGITFSMSEVSLGLALTLIGGETFVICLLGVVIGNRFGTKYKKKASYLGGAMLVGIGIKLLLSGLGILGF